MLALTAPALADPLPVQSARVVDYHIVNLRRKLEAATGEAEPCRLITVHGSGYKFVP